MKAVDADAPTESLCQKPDPPVIRDPEPFFQVVIVQAGEIAGIQTVHVLLQRADCLHEAALKASADRHHLAGSLHLGPQHMIRGAELVEGQPRHLDHTVIQSRLKAGCGLPGDRVPDLVQAVSQRRLRRHPGDGIARGLGCQSRGPGDTRVHLDHDILEAFGMQGELNVAAPDDLQL